MKDNNERLRFIVIGISDDPHPWFPPEVLAAINGGRVFSGGRRHREIVAGLLPQGAQWIDITVPLAAVFERYRGLGGRTAEGDRQSAFEAEDCRVAPLPCRGGAGGGVGDSNLCGGKLQTPPPTPPRKGRVQRGERTREAEALTDGRGEQAQGATTIVVFASGDPLFFGFANTLRREFPRAAMRVYPAFNSLQTLAHRLLMPYHDMRIVSLTGRPWQEFDRALIERAPFIGILTDREKTPAAIARRCREYGFEGYSIFVGERLGNPELERISLLSLTEVEEHEFTMPNCLILSMEADKRQNQGLLTSKLGHSCPFGLPDSSFALLDGREKMITKMPIRLLTLQALELPRASVFWDVGACTGSVSIEARLLFPHLRVVAFEIRPECEAIIRENCRRHGAPGIELVMGDFLALGAWTSSSADAAGEDDRAPRAGWMTALPRPDAVFIGGHGGRLKDIMARVLTVLAPGGVIVMNSVVAPKVLTDSRRLWDEACQELGLRQDPPLHIQLNDNHPITILKCRR